MAEWVGTGYDAGWLSRWLTVGTPARWRKGLVAAGLDDLLVLRAHVLVLVGAGLIMGGEAEAGCSFAAMLVTRHP